MTGKQFKHLRESIEWSQAKLAKEMDVTIRSLTRWETDAVAIPKIAALALKYIVQRARTRGTK